MGVVLIGLLIAILVVLLRDSTEPRTDREQGHAGLETFKAVGSLELIGDVANYSDGCYGEGGYDDIQPGAQVVIRDSTGTTVAIGELGSGFVPEKYKDFGVGEDALACAWEFSVEGIPAGSPIYSVEVTHRGEVSFKEGDAESISLSLG